MPLSYPSTYAHVQEWAHTNNFPISEAQERFAQYGILCAVSLSSALRQLLVFKGGNALDFYWHPNRSTKDLDFSALEVFDIQTIQQNLTKALDQFSREQGILYRIQSCHQNPPGKDKTFATFQLKIGYALPDASPRIREHIQKGNAVSETIPVEISINEKICAFQEIDLGERTLKISTREDIFAEKLRALLQQITRNRYRSQDLLDLATQLANPAVYIDTSLVSRFLLEKAHARNIAACKSAFRNPEVYVRAQKTYAELEETTRFSYMPFEEARSIVLRFCETLAIPEDPP
jgi:predicted nucleotidyltransferase component of viral defense system